MSVGGFSFGRGIRFFRDGRQVVASPDGRGGVTLTTQAARRKRAVSRVMEIPFLRGFFAMGPSPVLLIVLAAAVVADLTGFLAGDAGGAWMDAAEWIVTAALAVFIALRLFVLRDALKFHGAEHKVINAYEAGLELTDENIRSCSRVHPRCGTIWAIYAVLITIPCYFLPFVSLAFAVTISLSYELFVYAGRFRVLRWLYRLGLWLQKTLTTAEPDAKHIEVARRGMLALVSTDDPAKSVVR